MKSGKTKPSASSQAEISNSLSLDPGESARYAELCFVIWQDSFDPDAESDAVWVDVPPANKAVDRAICFDVGWVLREDETVLELGPSLGTWHSNKYRVVDTHRRGVITKGTILKRYTLKIPKRMMKYE